MRAVSRMDQIPPISLYLCQRGGLRCNACFFLHAVTARNSRGARHEPTRIIPHLSLRASRFLKRTRHAFHLCAVADSSSSTLLTMCIYFPCIFTPLQMPLMRNPVVTAKS